jgi:acetyl-CoA carboxylase biotin carboxyl carrier protein
LNVAKKTTGSNPAETKTATDKDDTARDDAIRALARLIDETGLTEIEVERGGMRIRVARQSAIYAAPAASAPAGFPSPARPPIRTEHFSPCATAFGPPPDRQWPPLSTSSTGRT